MTLRFCSNVTLEFVQRGVAAFGVGNAQHVYPPPEVPNYGDPPLMTKLSRPFNFKRAPSEGSVFFMLFIQGSIIP